MFPMPSFGEWIIIAVIALMFALLVYVRYTQAVEARDDKKNNK